MDHFQYKNGQLYAEEVAVADICAEYGTPVFIYSRATLERHWHAFDNAFGNQRHMICYAVKANSNLAVLNVLAKLGSGFDIVSKGELQRVLAAGGSPEKVVFSGVGKTREEITFALQSGVYSLNVESASELKMIEQVAGGLGLVADISIRVNPDVDAHTHPYISTGLKENKFGIEIHASADLFRYAHNSAHLHVKGVDCHIGSQLTEIPPFMDAIDRVLGLIKDLSNEGIEIEHFDIGGGLGIPYKDETPPSPAEYASAIANRLENGHFKIIIEPGRAIVGNAGLMVSTVLHLKQNQAKHFAVVDAAMNDLLRPALYSSWQEIIPVIPREDGIAANYDIVGPVCETADFIGKGRDLNLLANDLLAVRSAGAYGFVMSSNYNSRPRAAEVMVDGDQCHLVRARETFPDLIKGETLLPE